MKYGKVIAAYNSETQRNGAPWPHDRLERWILAWLQTKAEHGYMWSEWAAAAEAAEAVKAWYEG